ncbi:MAG: D-mannonate dehydratase [Spirochaetaceae bacterium]|nr:MAG: D-mannonate dehydratase [Spirochaetaceae bacterium]
MIDQHSLSVLPGLTAREPGIQIGTQIPADAPDEALTFAAQLGLEWVMTSVRSDAEHSADAYRAVVKRFAEYGLKVYRLANDRCHNMDAVTLGLPSRDEKIEEYLTYIRNLAAAGITYSTYAHMANGIWSSGHEPIRGGASGRVFRKADARGRWGATMYDGPVTHGRDYTEDEIRRNYEYFIRKVVPVAEEAGVYIGIHPDDPPVYGLGGVPRCLFGTFDGYKQAIEIADSPNIGVCLCVGCWLEGGDLLGGDVFEMIRYFGERKKIFKVHFRNVTEPLPDGFTETFLDDGYMDMARVVRALADVGFDGAIISDHRPAMVGGHYAAEAFAVGFMRALIRTVGS